VSGIREQAKLPTAFSHWSPSTRDRFVGPEYPSTQEPTRRSHGSNQLLIRHHRAQASGGTPALPHERSRAWRPEPADHVSVDRDPQSVRNAITRRGARSTHATHTGVRTKDPKAIGAFIEVLAGYAYALPAILVSLLMPVVPAWIVSEGGAALSLNQASYRIKDPVNCRTTRIC
jgi:hypothetical protein